MSIRHNGKVIAGATQYHPDLFDWKWADHQLDDAQWLRADTFSWQSGAVYESAYQHLVDDYDNGVLESETVNGQLIYFHRASDGHKVVMVYDDDTHHKAVETIYNSTGVAWYYIIDTTNQKFKLPRTKFGVTGLRNTVGKYIEESVPNIKTDINLGDGRPLQLQSASGAIYNRGNGSIWSAGSYWQGTGARPAFDASLVSSAYKDGAPVQPKATEMYLYFYVGQFTQTALENTAGLNTELFNGKADVSTVAHVVTEFQEPTSANNYTWYRKYADGWVEQGGTVYSIPNNSNVNVTLPVPMKNYGYTVVIAQNMEQSSFYYRQAGLIYNGRYPTYFVITNRRFIGESTNTLDVSWQVSGMAA